MPKLDTKWYKRKTHLQIGTLESIASSGLASQKEITPKKKLLIIRLQLLL
jgi:hypothetical protein